MTITRDINASLFEGRGPIRARLLVLAIGAASCCIGWTLGWAIVGVWECFFSK